MNDLVRKIVDTIAERAKEELKETSEYNSELIHIFDNITLNKKEVHVIRIGWYMGDPLRKAIMLKVSEASIEKQMNEQSVERKLLCVCIITDCFVSTQKIKEADIGKPYEELDREYASAKDDPAKSEAIMVSICEADDSEVIEYYYTRKGDIIEFLEMEEPKKDRKATVGGLMTTLFPDKYK